MHFFPTGTQLPGVGMDFSFISLKIKKSDTTVSFELI